MMWLLKILLDFDAIKIYHKFNGDSKSHVIFVGTQETH
jgi:hypothetical protein